MNLCVSFRSHRPKSSLERGQSRLCSRPGTANVNPIDEDEEYMPEPENESSISTQQVLKLESTSATDDHPPPSEPHVEVKKTKSKRLSVAKKEEEAANSATKKRNSSAVSKDKVPSATNSKKDSTKLGRNCMKIAQHKNSNLPLYFNRRVDVFL